MEGERYVVNPHLSRSECSTSGEGYVELPDALRSAMAAALTSQLPLVDAHHLPSPQNLTVYTGSAGVALLHLHLALTLHSNSPTQYPYHLTTALRLLNHAHPSTQRHAFLNGDAGTIALAAVIHGYLGNTKEAKELVVKLCEIRDLPEFSSMPSELLFGHVGYLYALLFVNTYLPGAIEESIIIEVTNLVLETGDRGRERDKPSPLMYTWHHKHYLGAAHGLAGILHMLLQVPVESLKDKIHSLVRPTLDYLLSLQFPSGNFPSSLESGHSDKLVHWCHGAPGFVHLLLRAYNVFGDAKYLSAAQRCGELVWTRGLLKKGYSLCHGVAGNTYSFLRLYQVTGESKYLHRAFMFADWCVKDQQGSTPDHPFSLFEGLAGRLYLYADLLSDPRKAVFPAMDLPVVTMELSP